MARMNAGQGRLGPWEHGTSPKRGESRRTGGSHACGSNWQSVAVGAAAVAVPAGDFKQTTQSLIPFVRMTTTKMGSDGADGTLGIQCDRAVCAQAHAALCTIMNDGTWILTPINLSNDQQPCTLSGSQKLDGKSTASPVQSDTVLSAPLGTYSPNAVHRRSIRRAGPELWAPRPRSPDMAIGPPPRKDNPRQAHAPRHMLALQHHCRPVRIGPPSITASVRLEASAATTTAAAHSHKCTSYVPGQATSSLPTSGLHSLISSAQLHAFTWPSLKANNVA
ncbi:uncharacterized protein CLUP02_14408 [Colletotrichum lupini]|uniref:Uncharacterized protein n=1 Tax=Colletotrichum lupini TaxID=145971 RepID=A0A9Q8WMP6_9PEZI|nr:uncharacterized protein CLUP02_14408 [Colletotrichum lupini]UQC88881.1 hypothetical protein CLUP02_14408 [Colletotrichum lupini]